MSYHTALDVSLRSVSICIVDDEGTIHFEGKTASEVNQIVACLKRFSPAIHSVGFEAGALTEYLTYGLQAAGYEVICLEARQVKSIAQVISPRPVMPMCVQPFMWRHTHSLPARRNGPRSRSGGYGWRRRKATGEQ